MTYVLVRQSDALHRLNGVDPVLHHSRLPQPADGPQNLDIVTGIVERMNRRHRLRLAQT